MNQTQSTSSSTNGAKPMLVQIAIESIGKTGSLAIVNDETAIWSRQLPSDQRTAASMAVHLQECLQWCKESELKLDFASIAVGPGSFTGLRIGITTAKTLGYALSLPIVPVGSLAAIATCASQDASDATASGPPAVTFPDSIAVGLNAYRGQVFSATFRRSELLSPSKYISERAEVIARAEWDQRLSALHSAPDAMTTGDISLFDNQSANRSEPELPYAVGVGGFAARLLKSQPEQRDELICDAFALSARYLKQSAAEEKASQRS